MLPAFIVAGGVAVFAVVMTGICYIIVRRERRRAAKSPTGGVSRA